MTRLQIIAHTAAEHKAFCAVYDPTSGPCDCAPARQALVSFDTAQRELALRDKQIAELQAQLSRANAALAAPPTAVETAAVIEELERYRWVRQPSNLNCMMFEFKGNTPAQVDAYIDKQRQR
jgi:hypothetical protein